MGPQLYDLLHLLDAFSAFHEGADLIFLYLLEQFQTKLAISLNFEACTIDLFNDETNFSVHLVRIMD